ncbi:MAG: DUF58 domain-containing protein [Candidatus Sericytochromatia bacterium]|nr:DUF58 domain-containing protein [Candidatus Sericytochromatia bacterium]
MQEKELITRIKNVQLKAKYLVTDVLVGEYKSSFHGQGMEFSEVREYIPGDDIRAIDWNVTARMDFPFIKKFSEERELTMFILVDLSSSQEFGSSEYLKHEIATELSAVLSYLALNNNDKVGLILFTDKIEKFIPAKKGKTNIWKIVREILSFKPENKSTNISVALEFLLNITKKKAIVFLISDFIAKDYDKSLKMVSKKHDLTTIKIVDPNENKLPEVGIVILEDSETGELIEIDTYDKKSMEAYQELKNQENIKFQKFIKSNKIDYLEINTSKPYIKDLVKFFKVKEKR